MSVEYFPNFYQDPKFLTTILVWVVYGATVVAYVGLKWQGRARSTVRWQGLWSQWLHGQGHHLSGTPSIVSWCKVG